MFGEWHFLLVSRRQMFLISDTFYILCFYCSVWDCILCVSLSHHHLTGVSVERRTVRWFSCFTHSLTPPLSGWHLSRFCDTREKLLVRFISIKTSGQLHFFCDNWQCCDLLFKPFLCGLQCLFCYTCQQVVTLWTVFMLDHFLICYWCFKIMLCEYLSHYLATEQLP
jgi:hypothetical protein